jgi:hypothetical protein
MYGIRTPRPTRAGTVGVTPGVGIAADRGGFVLKTELVRSNVRFSDAHCQRRLAKLQAIEYRNF